MQKHARTQCLTITELKEVCWMCRCESERSRVVRERKEGRGTCLDRPNTTRTSHDCETTAMKPLSNFDMISCMTRLEFKLEFKLPTRDTWILALLSSSNSE